MAVQAQYPSNVLLFNRSVQETKNDYSLQTQQGAFLHQSHMLFNNGANANPLKRGRDIPSTGGGSSVAHQSSLESHLQFPAQLVDLSQLQNNQNNVVVSTGLRLAFGEQQQQLHLHNQQNSLSAHQTSSAFLSLLSEDLGKQIKEQRDEVDQFLHAQGERLRRTLAEKRKRHYRALLSAAEESASRRLRAKEAEAEKAARRNAELEARAAQLSVEAQVWQAKARAQEAAAVSLQAQLQQAIVSGGCARAGERQDGEGLSRAEPDAESAYVDPDRTEAVPTGPVCKACRTRGASVVVLPCRHLSVCASCDRMVQVCPLCLGNRSSSVEVFLT